MQNVGLWKGGVPPMWGDAELHERSSFDVDTSRRLQHAIEHTCQLQAQRGAVQYSPAQHSRPQASCAQPSPADHSTLPAVQKASQRSTHGEAQPTTGQHTLNAIAPRMYPCARSHRAAAATDSRVTSCPALPPHSQQTRWVRWWAIQAWHSELHAAHLAAKPRCTNVSRAATAGLNGGNRGHRCKRSSNYGWHMAMRATTNMIGNISLPERTAPRLRRNSTSAGSSRVAHSVRCGATNDAVIKLLALLGT
jgi:hypothetical protein